MLLKSTRCSAVKQNKCMKVEVGELAFQSSDEHREMMIGYVEKTIAPCLANVSD